MKNTNGGEQDATTVGHVPDSLVEFLYKPLLEKEIKMSCDVSAKAGVRLKVYGFKEEALRFPAFKKLASRKDLEV